MTQSRQSLLHNSENTLPHHGNGLYSTFLESWCQMASQNTREDLEAHCLNTRLTVDYVKLQFYGSQFTAFKVGSSLRVYTHVS